MPNSWTIIALIFARTITAKKFLSIFTNILIRSLVKSQRILFSRDAEIGRRLQVLHQIRQLRQANETSPDVGLNGQELNRTISDLPTNQSAEI